MDDVLAGMDIKDLSRATIRQCVNTTRELERISGEKFVHLEFGVPGLKAPQIGIDMQKLALDAGIGIRANISIVTLRVDLALPLYDPGYSAGERWLPSHWAWNKIVANFGINYPF